MSQERRAGPDPRNPRKGQLLGVVGGALAMVLLWLGSVILPLLLALLIVAAIAVACGAYAAPKLRRGATGANLAGLYSLIGITLVAVPLLLLGPGAGLTGAQVILFGLALAALSAMGGQLSGGR